MPAPANTKPRSRRLPADLGANFEGNESWITLAGQLVGKTVRTVRWMSREELEVVQEQRKRDGSLPWTRRPVVIEFTDGTTIHPESDDEGNNGGSIAGDIELPATRA